MDPYKLDEALHAGELAILAMALRAVLARAVRDEPEVVSVRIAATVDGTLAAIDVEVIGASGMALGGFSL